MHLLHFNMAAVSICCLLLLGGFSYRQSKPGVWAMLAGALGLLAVMASISTQRWGMATGGCERLPGLAQIHQKEERI